MEKQNSVLIDLLDKMTKKRKQVEIPNDDDGDIEDDIEDTVEREEFNAEKGKDGMKNPIVMAIKMIQEEEEKGEPEEGSKEDDAEDIKEEGETDEEEEDRENKNEELIKKLLANRK